ncbi:MAG: hypothetical protein IJE43_17890 [Alphaproteobacteria bacterium]|nr:hypothetical protein [Alphaproteobacteria bacterium]MBQ3513929.1 hypothetical protein [Lachnospiraceae bacterium]
MAKKIMFAKSNVDTDIKKEVYCGDLDKSDYETKYKGHLTCIKGCKARIKFTERKNDVKFFSTWNKEGHLHKEGCPYHVDYKGKIGRKKLSAYYERIELSEETILRRLQMKMEGLLKQYSEEDIVDPENGSMQVDETGNGKAVVYEEDENGDRSEHAPRIQYEDAEYISTDDIGCRKSVYGFINNVQLEEDKYKRKFAYFNLATKHSTVNIAFPEAFYSNELSAGVDEFEVFISKVKTLVEKYPDQIMVIAYGDITKKKKDRNGVNVSVISPNRVLVNNKTYKQIVYGGCE